MELGNGKQKAANSGARATRTLTMQLHLLSPGDMAALAHEGFGDPPCTPVHTKQARMQREGHSKL